jgi:L-asparaginase II
MKKNVSPWMKLLIGNKMAATTMTDMPFPASTSIAIINDDSVVFSLGGVNGFIKFHSAAKPFQALRFLREDYENPFRLSECERVMFASSHFGQDIHIDALESIMHKTGITEESLILPYSEPLGALANEYWRNSRVPKRKIFHQCSGKHLGYVVRAKEMGTNVNDYYLPDSPPQREALNTVGRFIGRAKIGTAPDNCGVPTYSVTLTEIASAYMKFVTEEPFAVNLLRRYAEYVEGDGAIATELMKAYPIVAKSSTNGVIAMGFPMLKMGVAISANSWETLAFVARMVINLFIVACRPLVPTCTGLPYKSYFSTNPIALGRSLHWSKRSTKFNLKSNRTQSASIFSYPSI